MTDVLLPSFTTWGQPVRKSRIQLQRGVFSPKVLSLVMSFVGTMVLNAEQLEQLYHKGVPIFFSFYPFLVISNW